MEFEIDEKLEERLREEIGQPYTDIKHGFKAGESFDLWFIVPPKYADRIELNQIVLIYDLIRKVWFGGRIRAIETRKTMETDREKEMYNVEFTPMIELVKELKQEFLEPVLVQVEPICMFKDGVKKPVSTCPTNASILLIPTLSPRVEGEPTLLQILGLPESGIPLGIYSQAQRPYIIDNNILIYKLNLNNIENKHTLILGSTGQGKTVFIKHLIRHLNKEGFGIVAYDIQGDIVQLPFGQFEEFNELFREQHERIQEVEQKFYEETKEERIGEEIKNNIRIIFPIIRNMDQASEQKRALLEEICKHLNIEFEELGLRFTNIRSYEQVAPYMPNLTDLALEALARIIREYGGVKLEDFIRNIEQDARFNGNNVSLRRLPGYPIHRNTFHNLIRNLRGLEELGVFDVERGDLDINKLMEGEKISIIYMEHLNEYQRSIFEHYIMYEIYKNKTRVEEPGLFIVIDEAHEVIPRKAPPGGYKEYVNEVARVFSKIAREGRKYGINLIISTHKPRDIHQVVYDLCGNIICFRLSIDDAREVGIPSELIHQLAQFNPGFALVNSPENTDISGVLPWIEVKTIIPNALHTKPKRFFDYIEKKALPMIKNKKTPEEVKEAKETMKKLL